MAYPKQIFALLMLLLAACQAVQPEPSATSPSAISPTGEILPTPSATATIPFEPTWTPSVTPVLTFTPGASPSPAPSTTPEVQFERLRVLALDNRVGGWMLTLDLPGVQGAMRLSLGGQSYSCVNDPAYPDRLFCQGLARPAYDAPLKLVLQDEASGEILYETTMTIPSALVLPPTPAGWGHNTCADRGKNVSCETECRIAPDGNPCIVATCTDACGPYFSVHTCPDMSLDFRSCSPEQWAALKKLYQIP
uniref:Uncharacterized protein n=1 Tax=Anaerolinea thermolimosa TaxID=229919 RepID=A0A7C4KGY4_9CHLR